MTKLLQSSIGSSVSSKIWVSAKLSKPVLKGANLPEIVA